MSADSVGADECETCFRIVLLAEVRWRFRQYDLERRSNMAAREMACESSAVATPEDRMNMNSRLTVGPNRNVAVECGDLDLFVDGIAQVALRLPVEIVELCVAERSDRRDLCCTQVLSICKVLEATHELVAGLEIDRVGAPTSALVQEF